MSQTHDEPVVIGRYTTEFEAILAKNMLSEAGIPAQVLGGITAGFRAESLGMVKLMVPSNFEERALELMIKHTNEVQAHIDEDGNEIDIDDDGDEVEGESRS